ncbi:MAG: sialate O-acetylesterase [Verrucomicrobia bacterium]|nr:sialate O-acetylesterase [Verrucomicrobiota bacterium]
MRATTMSAGAWRERLVRAAAWFRSACLVALAATVGAAAAPLRLAGLFGDGAVLQRDRPVPVWGWAAPGAAVSVEFRGERVTATADGEGRWQVSLPPMPAASDPAALVVRTAGEACTVADVVVGEVWLCSGQSNMEWTVAQSANAEHEIAAADLGLVRQFRIAKVPAEEPARDVRGGWRPALPAHVGAFSGVAYFFARDLHRALGVPVGLINASWGGKMIEVFLSAEAIRASPHAAAIQRRWVAERDDLDAKAATYPQQLAEWVAAQAAARAAGTKWDRPRPSDPRGIRDQHRPACVFNGMVAPVTPTALRGVIWYQGEHNVTRAAEYRDLFPALISDWRAQFGGRDLPFLFVQLAAYSAPLDRSRVAYAELREAQATALAVPGTGMAVALDLGSPGDVHPRNKQEVGVRLARVAKARVYGLGGEWSGPVFRLARREGETVRIEFDHAAGGLVARSVPVPGFELAGGDGVFHQADAVVSGAAVLVRSPAVPVPRAVRYAWANAPDVGLFNTVGLPAAPFRHSLP